MFEDICCYLGGHHIVHHQLTETGKEVTSFVQLLNFGVFILIICKFKILVWKNNVIFLDLNKIIVQKLLQKLLRKIRVFF